MVNVHMDVLIGVLCNKTFNRFNIPELWFLIRPEWLQNSRNMSPC